MSFVDFFLQFRTNRKHFENEFQRAREAEVMSTILDSFGPDIYDCSENFINQNIERKDLASLTRTDLELLGVKDKNKQDEMLKVFQELNGQDYCLNEVIESPDSQNFNEQMIDKAKSHLDTMTLALQGANLKLEILPSGDVVIDEKYFASKFVLDALDELKHMTDSINDKLTSVEKVSYSNAKFNNLIVTAIVSATVLLTGILCWKKKQFLSNIFCKFFGYEL